MVLVVVVGWFCLRKRHRRKFRAKVRKIKESRVNFLKVLSRGSVADVSKAVFKRKDVAVKMIHQEDEASFQELDHEIYINSLVPPHPNVAKLLGSLTVTQRGLVRTPQHFT